MVRAEPNRPDLAPFWTAWDLVQAHFVYRASVSTESMIYGAIRGMVESLGDDGHTRFLSPEQARSEHAELRGRFNGIGAEVDVRNGQPVVVAPLQGSPADQAGLC